MDLVSDHLRSVLKAASDGRPVVVDGAADSLPTGFLAVRGTDPHIVPPVLNFPLADAAISHLHAAADCAAWKRGQFRVPASRLMLSDSFRAAVDALGRECAQRLGVLAPGRQRVAVEPVELTLHEPVTFFCPRVGVPDAYSSGSDSSSEAGDQADRVRVATLFVHLPSAFTGGTLHTRVAGLTMNCDVSTGSAARPRFAALRGKGVFGPVLSGRRLCLEFVITRCWRDVPFRPARPLPVQQSFLDELKRAVRFWDRRLLAYGQTLRTNHVLLLDTVPENECITYDGLRGRDIQIIDVITKSECLGFGVAILEEEDVDENMSGKSTNKGGGPSSVKPGTLHVGGRRYKVAGWSVEGCENEHIDVTKFREPQEISIRKSHAHECEDADRNPIGHDGHYRLALFFWPLNAAFLLRCEMDFPSALSHCIDLVSASRFEEAMGKLPHLIRYADIYHAVSFEEYITMLDLTVQTRNKRLVSSVLRVFLNESIGHISRMNTTATDFRKAGIASAKAAATLGQLALTMLQDDDGSIERAALLWIARTPTSGLTHLAGFAVKMDGVVATLGAAHSAAVRRLVSGAARASAYMINVPIAACFPAALRLAERSKPTIGDELEATASAMWTPPTSRYGTQLSIAEVMKTAERCVRVGGRISWCVLLQYPRALVETLDDGITPLTGARTVWAGLLDWLCGTLHGCSEEALEKAHECAKALVKAAEDCHRDDELFGVMCKEHFRTQVRAGPGREVVEQAALRRITHLALLEKPVHSWRFPVPPGDLWDEVREFMTGDQKQVRIFGQEDGLRSKRKWVEDVTPWNKDRCQRGSLLWGYSGILRNTQATTLRETFSFMARAGGRGRNTFVEILKTDDAFKRDLNEFDRGKSELHELCTWICSGE